MALSGIQIYKLLPKTNCKECGFPTCLAFAMKLAAKQANLTACPYVSEESKTQLEAASQPPIHLVTIKSNGREVGVGNETTMFRHEKRFYNKPGLFIRLYDDLPVNDLKTQVKEIADYMVEYVGMELTVDGFAIEATGGGALFAAAVKVVQQDSSLPLILITADADVMEEGLQALSDQDVRPLIYGATAETWEAFAKLAKQNKAAMAICEEN